MRYASIASMNKTVYLRDEEVPVWERARELSGDKLSPVIISALKAFVAAKEAEGTGWQRILLEFNDANDNMLPKRKAFFGRWIISPEKRLVALYEDGDHSDIYVVAETAKGNVVVLTHSEDAEGMSGKKFLVYASFQKAAADNEVNYAIRKAMELRGVPVEELDI